MSKSWGNAIWLTDNADEIYGKAMSLPDELIVEYFENATNTDSQKIREIAKALKNGVNPIELKKELAYRLVLELRNKKEALKAKNTFEKSFQKHTPEYSLEVKLSKTLAETVAPYTNLKSVSDAKRLIQQGGLTINGDMITDFSFRAKKMIQSRLERKYLES